MLILLFVMAFRILTNLCYFDHSLASSCKPLWWIIGFKILFRVFRKLHGCCIRKSSVLSFIIRHQS